MKKKFLILPVLAALFAACTSDELVVNEKQTQQTEEDGAIAFDAYLNRAVTRAGAVGGIDLAKLQTTGFGVFGYYANGDLYSENAIPDFMYNQEVKYSGGWEYSPIKYWPNEFGSTAISTGVDRVTFFAYAPYVGVDPATGQLTSYYDNSTPEKSTETGITALTRNGKTGDPYVRYVGAFEPANCVDLLYGVAAENYTSHVGAADGANSINAGEPYINVAKPEVNSRLKFDFKHALAKLNVQVDADVDIAGHNESNLLDNNTRIWVRSISFDGVAQRGYLNLNNGIWYDVIDNTKISHASVTVHDGRRDGAEALADDSYETPKGFNPALMQNDVYTTTDGTNATGAPIYSSVSTTTTGVTATNQNLFSGSNDLLVIPANEGLKVTIVYDVETADPTLPTYLSDGKTKGSTVENKITKNITLTDGKALKLDAGKAYTINLHLGMTSVKFDATVSDWNTGDDTDDTWLPINVGVPAYVSVGSAAAADLKIPVSGLTKGSSLTAAAGVGDTWISSVSVAPATTPENGKATITYTVAENTGLSKKSGTITLTETITTPASVTNTPITITQDPAAIGLSVESVATDVIKLTTSYSPFSFTSSATTVIVKVNDVVRSTGYTFTSAGKCTFDPVLSPGQKVTFIVKNSDAEDTVTTEVPTP